MLLADGVGVQVVVADTIGVNVGVAVSSGVAVTVGVGMHGTAPVGTYDGLLVISTTSSHALGSLPRKRMVCEPDVSLSGFAGCWLARILSQPQAHCPPNWGSS